MALGDLLALGTLAYVVAVAGAHILAWYRRGGLAWLSLVVAAMVPVVLLMIGLGSNDAHGTGYYGLDLMMFVTLPWIWLATAVFGGTLFLVRRSRRREEAGQ
ncbi:hypothetical protein P1X14_20725 [Sphingomonas sp. AOB5]|uniref:hypothetical protein n=1 Tax=Sphingomonas sp. AOB5 TaxID=3034017 RepID=UPI0023F938B3|nr:hypothetical protein [Sphingomonas sp. AOB5]MDF7777692.1 hypothetical protein [Sphingomonas sp. AOB5]